MLSESMICLIDMASKKASTEKLREQAESVSKLYTPSAEKNASTYRFLLKSNSYRSNLPLSGFLNIGKYSSDEYLIRLLSAVEICRDEHVTLILCRFLLGFITHCNSSASLIRQSRIIRFDGTNSLIRCFVSFFTISEHSAVINVLCSLLIMISVQDKKFCLKARLSGLLMLFHKKLMVLVEDQNMARVLHFCCCCIRSARNARIFGKSEKFVKDLITIIVDDTDVVVLAHLMEILYLISKFRNRQVMAILDSNDIFLVLIKVFEKHLHQRFTALPHLEICLFAVASLRNLSRQRCNRDRLEGIGAIGTFHSAVSLTCNDRKRLDEDSPLLPSVLRLQDSLYALCMSCLPIRSFPLAPETPPPITFPLPVIISPRQHRSWSSGKNLASSFLTSSQYRQVEAPLSSDEDDVDNGDDDELFPLQRSDDDEDGDLMPNDSYSSLFDPPSKLLISMLSTDYSQYFTEFSNGTTSNFAQPEATCGNMKIEKFPDLVKKACKRTKSALKFVKIAYPATVAATSLQIVLQPLTKNDFKRYVLTVYKILKIWDLLMNEIAYQQNESNFVSRIVYDLDELITSKTDPMPSLTTLNNNDLSRIGKMDTMDHLLFESRFEGGNLRRAIQVSKWRYQLVLLPDINELRPHYQWFYFEISNNEANIDYTFEIINCSKKNSLFSHGMQPVLYSVTEACHGKSTWIRVGSAVSYYRNSFCRSNAKKLNDAYNAKYYFSLCFTIKFEHRADVCYIAYHFPYTYSMLQATIENYLSKHSSGLYIRNDELCTTLAGNSVSLLTITADGTANQLADRQVIFLCARVHPGESNSSWIMHGIIDYLMSDKSEAVELRNQFVFKLVPMLNIDGVVNGSHRCNLAGVDLNRTWDRPSPFLHPVIFHTKALVQYVVDVLGKIPYVFIDLHGHSNHFNIFLFGNNPYESWSIMDHSLHENTDFMSLPSYLRENCDYFSFANCRFNITKNKESAARVALWRQFGITRSYTVESTYCGFKSGPLKGYQINIGHLMEMGKQLCEAFSHLRYYNSSNERQHSEDLE